MISIENSPNNPLSKTDPEQSTPKYISPVSFIGSFKRMPSSAGGRERVLRDVKHPADASKVGGHFGEIGENGHGGVQGVFGP